MNPLMDALQKVEGARPAPASGHIDTPHDAGVAAVLQLGPIRATRDDVGLEAAAFGADSGPPQASALADALHADALHPGESPRATGGSSGSREDAMDGAHGVPAVRTAPLSLTCEEEDAVAGSAPVRPPFIGEVFASSEDRSDDLPDARAPAEPASASLDAAQAPERTARRPSPESCDTRAPPSLAPRAFDPGTLPPRRGSGRVAGVTLSLLAVVAASAGGGYLFWKTQLVRPALVRHLPAMSAAIVDLAPLHDANAATTVTGEPITGAAARLARHSEVSAPGGTQTYPAHLAAGDPFSNEIGVGPDAAAGSARQMTIPTAHDTGPGFEQSAAASESIDQDRAYRHDPSSMSRGSELAQPRRPTPPTAEPALLAASDETARAADSLTDAVEHVAADLRPDPGPGIEIRKRVRTDHVAASIERAYEAFHAGDGESAARAYQAALEQEPRNRDAHLGLAAVAARAGRWDEAAGHYARVLAFHPADTVARAALIAMDEQDPPRRESRLKALLWSEPRAAHLHFSLGNIYAAQSRWPEAQQSYLDAYHFDDGNADYAYNLAVSLDHLSQRESALDYYRKALALSRSGPASFDTTAVRARIRDMASPAGMGSTPTPSLHQPDGAGRTANER